MPTLLILSYNGISDTTYNVPCSRTFVRQKQCWSLREVDEMAHGGNNDIFPLGRLFMEVRSVKDSDPYGVE